MIGSLLRPRNGIETALRICLLALIMVFVVECIYFFLAQRKLTPLVGASLNDEIIVASAPVTLPPMDYFSETVERSLFSPDRKPVTLERQAKTTSGNPSERWALSAIINTGSDVYVIFAERAGGQTVRLQQGMYLEQWQIELISPDKVTLSYNGEEDTLQLQSVSKPQRRLNRRPTMANKPSDPDPDVRAARSTVERPLPNTSSTATPEIQLPTQETP